MSYMKREYQNTNNMKIQNHSKRTLVLIFNEFGIEFKHLYFCRSCYVTISHKQASFIDIHYLCQTSILYMMTLKTSYNCSVHRTYSRIYHRYMGTKIHHQQKKIFSFIKKIFHQIFNNFQCHKFFRAQKS